LEKNSNGRFLVSTEVPTDKIRKEAHQMYDNAKDTVNIAYKTDFSKINFLGKEGYVLFNK
jgi:hypothetical protein